MKQWQEAKLPQLDIEETAEPELTAYHNNSIF